MSRGRPIALLLGVALALLVAVAGFILYRFPYLQYEWTINRRTGEPGYHRVYCGLLSGEYTPAEIRHLRKPYDLSKHGPLLAPDSDLVIYSLIKQEYPWSPAIDPVHLKQKPGPGYNISRSYGYLFDDLILAERHPHLTELSELPRATRDAEFRKRLDIWNSQQLETESGPVVDHLIDENVRLYEMAMELKKAERIP